MSRSPESAPVTVSVIVPAHNAALTIGEQLAALSAQTYGAPYEVIVVANRCSDDRDCDGKRRTRRLHPH